MEKFNVGDHIVYDTYGICVVKQIKRMSFFPGAPLQNYYVLCVLENPNSTYYIPCENEALFVNTEWIENRQLRNEQYRKIISDGVSPELVSLIHCIYKKKS